MYYPTNWEDHVNSMPGVYKIEVVDESKNHYSIQEAGEVMVPGTPQDQAHFNNLETGVHDANIAMSLILNFARQLGWRTDALETATVQEVGTVSLTNTQQFPFNSSKKSVALANRRDNLNYIVVIVAVTGSGNIGEVEVTDRLVNGFKLNYTGSAPSAAITYAVIGGYDK